MLTLVLGLVVFVGIHLVLSAKPSLRDAMVERLGRMVWRAIFSIVSAVGLYLIVTGYGAARYEPVVIWSPPAFLSHLTALLVVVAFIFAAAAYVPGNGIKARVGHPMLIGVKTWALAHLLVNGNLADMVLFLTFLAWAVFAYIKHRKADRAAGVPTPASTKAATLLTVAVGVVTALLFAFWLHPMLIGVPAIIRA